MDRTPDQTHRITVCTLCRHTGSHCKPGYDMIVRLRAALNAAGGAVADDFEVAGVTCMAGCDRPCTVAYQVTAKATYLFGDIDADQDIGDLVAFAKQYQTLESGWSSSSSNTRPEKLQTSTLAGMPAAMIVTHASAGPVS